jgi:thiol-disulfide isomerase/thioredoxin
MLRRHAHSTRTTVHAGACAATTALVGFAACNGSSRPSEPAPREAAEPAARTASSSAGSGPRFVPGAPAGDVAGLVARASSAASADHRLVVVYVGATWCEPCQRFHRAVEGGELTSNPALSNVTFLEFDLDRDRDRLAAAGYKSKYIPLFALPGPDGRSSGQQVEGGIKGDGAVAYMVPRLTALLAL